MSEHEVLFGFRLRLFSLAEELGTVSEACRLMGVNRSMYYRLKPRVDRWGLEALRVRERRRPRMPNELGPHLEQRIIAFSLAHPGYGSRRISAELDREKWGGLRVSEHGVWRVLRRYGLNTRAKRCALIAGYAARYERRPPEPPPTRRVPADRPGQLIGLDCFFIGRLSGTRGSVWQYTAIDLALAHPGYGSRRISAELDREKWGGLRVSEHGVWRSGFAWAELHASPKNPRARHCRALVDRVAQELARAGWRLEAALTDNGSEFRSREFTDRLAELGIEHRRVRAGRPTANGDAERLQQTILEECWRPSFARSLVPKLTALERDLESYLWTYNFDRAHTGWRTRGRIPADIVYGGRKTRPVR
jgi:transposase